MSAIIKEVTTLLGSKHEVPHGQRCDDHPHVFAIARIQGETTASGTELNDLCSSCFRIYVNSKNTLFPGVCGWCKIHSNHLRSYRSLDKKIAGGHYNVCFDCIKEDEKRKEISQNYETPDIIESDSDAIDDDVDGDDLAEMMSI